MMVIIPGVVCHGCSVVCACVLALLIERAYSHPIHPFIHFGIIGHPFRTSYYYYYY